jgi:hypothetical protein
MKKYLFYGLTTVMILLLGGSVVYAEVFGIRQGGTANGSPPSANSLIFYDAVTGQYTSTSTQPLYVGTVNATSTTATSTLPNLDITQLLINSDYITDFTGTNLSVTNGVLNAAGGGGSGNVATSSAETSGYVPFWTSTGATPATLSGGVSSLFWDNGNTRLGIGSSTPGSLLSVGGVANFTTATSTFYGSGGIDITNGCFAISGTCLATGGGAGTPGGSDGQIQYNNSSAFGGDASLFWDDTKEYLGVGTSTPYARLTVWGKGTTIDPLFEFANSASTTLAWGDDAGNFYFENQRTDIDNLYAGPQSLPADAGQVSWLDVPVTSSSADNTIISYTASIDGEPMLTLSAQADGSGGIDNQRWGFGTSTPAFQGFSFTEGASATTTINFGDIGDTSSKVQYNMKTNTGGNVCAYIVGTTWTIDSGVCN